MTQTDQDAVETKTIYGPCALIFSSAKTGAWRIVRPVVDKERCVACGICEKHCPTAVMTTQKEKSSPANKPRCSVDIDLMYCKGCGICANVCPKDSIAMVDEREA